MDIEKHLPWGWELFEFNEIEDDEDEDAKPSIDFLVVDSNGKSFDGIFDYDVTVKFEDNGIGPRGRSYLIEYDEGGEEVRPLKNEHKEKGPWNGSLSQIGNICEKANKLARKWHKEGEAPRRGWRPPVRNWAPPEEGEEDGFAIDEGDLY